MRIAVLSDIHGNLEAFEAVLKDMDRTAPDAVISLGDNIGYGPDPEAVVRRMRENEIPSVLGNHEMVVANPSFINWFNEQIQASMQITLDALSEESVTYIRDLEEYISRWNCRFVHGFPPRSPSLYLFQMTENQVLQTFEFMEERICFVGHTHELRQVEYDGEAFCNSPLSRETVSLHPDRKYIINVGSVGQPRDGDNRAKYVIWDEEENTLEVRYVTYDIETVVKKILDAGLPEVNALRLR